MKKPVLIGLISCGGLIVIGILITFAFLMYVGTVAPETFVQPGHAMNKAHLAKIRDLQLIEPDEKILFFYSDAMLDIEEGMYVLTDQKLFLYSKSWDDPFEPIAFSDITDVRLDRDTSYFIDSTLTIDLADDTSYWFPLSSEGSRDIDFADKLRVLSNVPEALD